MKTLTLNIILLITAAMPLDLKAQEKPINTIDWHTAGEIPGEHQYRPIGLAGAVSGVTNHVLLVAGGTNFPDKMPWAGGSKHYYAQVYVYEKDLSSSKLKRLKEHFLLPFNLGYSAVCSTEFGLIVAGGENESGNSNKVLCLNWKSENKLLNISYLPDLPFAVSNASLCVIGEVIYLAGGEIDGKSSQMFLALNLKSPNAGWKKLNDLPQPTSHSVLLAAQSGGSKEVFLIGGRRKNASAVSTIYNQLYAYNVQENTWVSKQPLPYQLSAASGIAYGNQLLVFSGDQGETFNKVENLLLKIATEKETNHLKALTTEKEHILAGHPGFSTGVLRYNVGANVWDSLNPLPAQPPVTTNAVLWDDQIFISGGEIRAGVRSAAILCGQIK